MAPKRKTKNAAVVAVVDAITECEALPADLRSLLGSVLPSILNTNKIDRHAYAAEVVDQALVALTAVGKAGEAEHSEALEKQKALVSPAERAAREAAEKEAAGKQTQAQSQVETCETSKKAADKATHEAEQAVKLAQKEETAAEKVVAKTTLKRSTLEGAVTNGFATLTSEAKKSEKDAAVRQLSSLGKENGVGSTLLQAFGLACKTESSQRSEFEATTLAAVKTKLEEGLAGVSKQLEDEVAAVEQKKAETAAAKEKLVAAEAAQKAAVEALGAARDGLKEAKKALSQATTTRENIWLEMKTACDKQDELAKAVRHFKEVIMPAFLEAQEKVAPVEEPAEPPEKKQKTEEEAVAPEAAGDGNAD